MSISKCGKYEDAALCSQLRYIDKFRNELYIMSKGIDKIIIFG